MPAYDNIDALIGPPMHAVANAIRGMICAPKGRKLIAADFSQIEARVNPWLAGEEHVVDAFRAYDRNTRRKTSEYGTALIEKQKLRFISLFIKHSPVSRLSFIPTLFMGLCSLVSCLLQIS